jgi:FYVE zinc finger
VAGFTDENVRVIAGRFVDALRIPGQASRAPGVLDVLLSQLRRTRVIWELSHILINLVLMCHVFVDDALKRPQVPTRDVASARLSLSQLYRLVQMMLWRRYITRAHKDVDVNTLDDVAVFDQTFDLAFVLQKLAYFATLQGIVMLPGKLIESCLDDDQTVDQLLLSGFVVQAGGEADTGDWRNKQYHFLHLTLQEYFAGQFIQALLSCSDTAPIEEDLSVLRTNKDSSQLEVIWWFVAGELARKAEAAPKPQWLDESGWDHAKACSVCGKSFGMLNRRHHCRVCGGSVCNAHSQHELPHP